MSNNIPEFYTLWKIKEHLTIPDPEETQTRYHTYLFVQNDELPTAEPNTAMVTHADKIAGWTHEVTGDIVSSKGMTYIHKPVRDSPEHSEVFYQKYLLGRVRAADYPKNVDAVCRSIQPPGAQKMFNTESMRFEGVVFEDGGDRMVEGKRWRFYAPGEERRGYFKCTEWVEVKVVPKLIAEGILVQ